MAVRGCGEYYDFCWNQASAALGDVRSFFGGKRFAILT